MSFRHSGWHKEIVEEIHYHDNIFIDFVKKNYFVFRHSMLQTWKVKWNTGKILSCSILCVRTPHITTHFIARSMSFPLFPQIIKIPPS